MMIRKQYLMDHDDLIRLREKMPYESEAALIRASVKAALALTDKEFQDLCLASRKSAGRPKNYE